MLKGCEHMKRISEERLTKRIYVSKAEKVKGRVRQRKWKNGVHKAFRACGNEHSGEREACAG